MPLSARENSVAYIPRMARLPRKKPFTRDIDNLFADWRQLTDAPAPTGERPRLALLRHSHLQGRDRSAAGSAPVYEFTLWERIRLQAILELEHPPGKELAPQFMQEWRRGYE